MGERILGFILLCVGSFTTVSAQSIEQHIQQHISGTGDVTLHISPQVRDAIEGKHQDSEEEKTVEDKIRDLEAFRDAPKMKVMGYRVQVYGGGNSRANKLEAQRLGAEVKRMFPEYPVYTHFESPRWVCKVGNFVNRGEATAAWNRLKNQGGFRQAIVVRDQILVAK